MTFIDNRIHVKRVVFKYCHYSGKESQPTKYKFRDNKKPNSTTIFYWNYLLLIHSFTLLFKCRSPTILFVCILIRKMKTLFSRSHWNFEKSSFSTLLHTKFLFLCQISISSPVITFVSCMAVCNGRFL